VTPTTYEEDDMQGKRTRALDSRGRPVPGLYTRDERFIAGFTLNGNWTMKTLSAETLTEARRERERLVAGLREGRVAAPSRITFGQVFAEYQASRSISDRTQENERYFLDRHLDTLKARPVQGISSSDVARLLRAIRDRGYAPWTQHGAYRVLSGTFALATRRGIITRNPMDGLAPSERPKQRNARKIRRLTPEETTRLVAAAGSERWRAAIGLAGLARLRLGEIRALTWADVMFDQSVIQVRRSLLDDGTPKVPKSEAGVRVVPVLPALRRLLAAWKLRSPHARPNDLVVSAAKGGHVPKRNLRRALEAAKANANLNSGEERLSWHSLRHSFASTLATDLELAPTTLAEIVGHSDPGFPLKVYARDARDREAVVSDVLAGAAGADIGS
jgi:integrase